MLYKRGSKWWFKFRFAGRVYREPAKTSSQALARKVERVRRREIEAAYSRVPKRRAPRTIQVEARDWLALKATPLAANSLRILESTLRLHLLPKLHDRLLLDIDAHTIADYQRRRLTEGASPKSINLEVGTLRGLLRHHGLWTEDLRRDVRPLKVRDDHGIALTQEEEERLLDACRASRSPSLLPAVVVALNTGLRYTELRLLIWRQIDFLKAHVTVGQSKTAAGTGRVVPLNGRALNELQRWATRVPDRQPNHYVFPAERIGQGGSYVRDSDRPIGSWKTAWATAKRKADVTARFHDIRHTACTRMLEDGIGLSVVARILGWSPATTAVMAKRYGHIGDSALRAAVTVLDTSAGKSTQGGHKKGHSSAATGNTTPVNH